MHASLLELTASIAGARLVQGVAPAVEPDLMISGVSLDSRSVSADALFVALRGETFDAHDFLEQVAAKGCAAVLVEALPAGWTLPAIVAPNTLVALGQIANFWRRRHALPLIGVTGSNGKTTVKEMIAAILAAAYGEDGHLATRGNLNNEIGVPLTLLRLETAHQAAVIELGMNHPGEIARLTAIAQPTLALVNNAQREHQEFMHSVAAVASENGAVLAGLAFDGVAVFPGDDEFTELWRGLKGSRRALTFGLTRDCDVSCTWRAHDFGNEMQVAVCGEAPFSVALAAAGEHNVRNALAAVACTFGVGVRLDAIKRGLEAFVPVNGRLQKKVAPNGVIVIDDSYNANPDSVRAAIDVLAQAPAPRILVLGDMGEVGAQGQQFHEEIGIFAASKGIEHVFTTGQLARHVAGANVEHFEQFDALLAALDRRLANTVRATVLIKGSRFMKMERAVQHLIIPKNNNKENH